MQDQDPRNDYIAYLEGQLAEAGKMLEEAREILASLYHDHPAGLSGSTSRAYEAAKIYLDNAALREQGGEVGK